MNAQVYVVCEKPKLINQIKKECLWHGKSVGESDIKFFPADFESLTYLAKTLVVPNWVNAAVSHLTTFKHASENYFDLFWNIDADDTFFSLSPQQVADVLLKVQNDFVLQHLDMCSLDMHHSLNGGRHWTFGVCLTRNIPNFFNLLLKHKQACHLDFEGIPQNIRNLDYFITFLPKYEKNLNIRTFFVKNAGFTHYGLGLASYPGVGTTIWYNKNLLLPFIQGDIPYSFPIPDGTLEIDIGLHPPVTSMNAKSMVPLSDLELKLLQKLTAKHLFYSFMSKFCLKSKSFERRALRARNQINALITSTSISTKAEQIR